ncbi:hypothetical protein HZA98_01780 [Candidatus Woesearchaeota archaeon]|nr:hypothetical protein [Candidatus Woesearchaeota archaeon]
MAEPSATRFKPKEEKEPEAKVLKDVKITPLEKSSTPDNAAKLGFKKTNTFTDAKYAYYELWEDNKGNAIIKDERGGSIKEGEVVERFKNGAVTIRTKNGQESTYHPDGIVTFGQMILDGPRHSK